MIAATTFYFSRPKEIPRPILLEDFHERKIIKDDTWNNVKGGEIRYEYYHNEFNHGAIPVGYIEHRLKTGQINFLNVWGERFKKAGMREYLLEKALIDIQNYGTASTIWAVSMPDDPFWSTVWDKSFIWSDPAHPSVTGRGYYYTFN